MIQECYRDRRPLPKSIRNAPELLMGLEFTYGAFIDLNVERSFGWVPGPIPWSSIYDYARTHDLTPEETEDLTFLIRRMDEAYLRYHDEKAKAKG